MSQAKLPTAPRPETPPAGIPRRGGVLRDLSLFVISLAVASIVAALAYRIATGTEPLASLSFEQLLSLVLALFAIGLSWLFYDRANATANDFYVKIFEYAKDNSVSLEGMQERIGAGLTRLDEHYEGMALQFERHPSPNASALLADLRSTMLQLGGRGSDQMVQLEELAKRHDLPGEAKQALEAVIESSSSAVETATAQISQKMDDLEEAVERTAEAPRNLMDFLEQRLVPPMREVLAAEGDEAPTDAALSAAFARVSLKFTRAFLAEMRKHGLAQSDRQLTRGGLTLFRSLLDEAN